jgi:hypothetical protein
MIEHALHRRGLPPVRGLLAAPPCDCFTKASARLWAQWDQEQKTHAALRLVDRALFMGIMWDRMQFWCVENPPGRLWNKGGTGLRQKEFDGAPDRGQYRPCDYGATKEQTKLTYLWGKFVMPPMTRRVWGPPKYKGGVDPVTRTGGSARTRKIRRSTTPVEFARAFASVNRLEE